MSTKKTNTMSKDERTEIIENISIALRGQDTERLYLIAWMITKLCKASQRNLGIVYHFIWGLLCDNKPQTNPKTEK